MLTKSWYPLGIDGGGNTLFAGFGLEALLKSERAPPRKITVHVTTVKFRNDCRKDYA